MGSIALEAKDARMAASILRWWSDAGADTLVDDEPRVWRSEPAQKRTASPIGEQRTAPLAVAPKPVPSAPQLEFPTHDALLAWLMTSPDVPQGGTPRWRIGPAGTPGAPLMVLADMPERDDSGALLSGALAGLFDNMLASMGKSRATIYLASLAPARSPTGRIDDPALATLGPIALRHIALAAPQQLWLMGAAASRAILGMSDREAHGRLHSVNHDGRTIPTIVTAHPRTFTKVDDKRPAWANMKLLMKKDIV